MAYNENDKTLLGLVTEAWQGKVVTEEKDPDDNQTGELLPIDNDHPHVKRVRHRVTYEIGVTRPDFRNPNTLAYNPIGNHHVAEQVIEREPTESYEDFSNRVGRHLEGSLHHYNEVDDQHETANTYVPEYDLDAIAAEANGNGWAHAGRTAGMTTYVNKHSNLGTQNQDMSDDAGSIDHSFNHYLKVEG